jgi:hypothetical protein
MNTVKLFQYSKEIELVCQDAANSASMNRYLGNTVMYDTHHKLHKGIDNTFRFVVRDTDRKTVDLTGKTMVFKLHDRKSRENVLFRYPVITNAIKGMATLTIADSETAMLPQGFYQYAMYTIDGNGVEEILYTDLYENGKGTFEVVDNIYPEFSDSQQTSTFYFDGNKHTSSVFDGSSNTVYSRSLHTIALYFEGFTGVVHVQGDLSVSPSNEDKDWFDLTPQLMYDGNITINNETGVQGYVVQANVNWLRIIYTATSGSITKVLVRN